MPVRVHRELFDEERTHVALLEVAGVDPAVAAADLVGALGVGDDLTTDREEELLDALFLVDLRESLLRSRALVLEGRAVHVAEAELEELPDLVEIAAMDPLDLDLI